jgi:hypothetical protein
VWTIDCFVEVMKSSKHSMRFIMDTIEATRKSTGLSRLPSTYRDLFMSINAKNLSQTVASAAHSLKNLCERIESGETGVLLSPLSTHAPTAGAVASVKSLVPDVPVMCSPAPQALPAPQASSSAPAVVKPKTGTKRKAPSSGYVADHRSSGSFMDPPIGGVMAMGTGDRATASVSPSNGSDLLPGMTPFLTIPGTVDLPSTLELTFAQPLSVAPLNAPPSATDTPFIEALSYTPVSNW